MQQAQGSDIVEHGGGYLLLVEEESAIPFQRFRMAGSRDYRRPPEACLDAEADGVTLALDLGRSDLLVDAELARFADELPLDRSTGAFSTAQVYQVLAQGPYWPVGQHGRHAVPREVST